MLVESCGRDPCRKFLREIIIGNDQNAIFITIFIQDSDYKRNKNGILAGF